VLAIDRLEFIGDRLAVLGPTSSPQPVPLRPARSFFRGYEGNDAAGLPVPWSVSGGRWGLREGQAVQQDTRPGELSEARLPLPAGPLLLEVSIQALPPPPRGPGAYGLLLIDKEGNETFSLELLPRSGGADQPEKGTATALAATGSGEERKEQALPLPRDFSSLALHLFHLELDGQRASLSIDGISRWRGRLPALPAAAILFTRSMAAGFSAFELTLGWEDLFWQAAGAPPASDPAPLGWETVSGEWVVQDGQLWHTNPEENHALILKGPPLNDYELVANLRLAELAHPDSAFGFSLGPTGADEPFLIVLEPLLPDLGPGRWALVARTPNGRQAFPLPAGFDPTLPQQIRLAKRGQWLTLQREAEVLGEIPVFRGPGRIGLYAHRAEVRIDMVRITALSESNLYG
jgi:hypothetical protein